MEFAPQVVEAQGVAVSVLVQVVVGVQDRDLQVEVVDRLVEEVNQRIL